MKIDEEQLVADSMKLRMPNVRELNLLENYLNNKGILPTQVAKCPECSERNCKKLFEILCFRPISVGHT